MIAQWSETCLVWMYCLQFGHIASHSNDISVLSNMLLAKPFGLYHVNFILTFHVFALPLKVINSFPLVRGSHNIEVSYTTPRIAEGLSQARDIILELNFLLPNTQRVDMTTILEQAFTTSPYTRMKPSPIMWLSYENPDFFHMVRMPPPLLHASLWERARFGLPSHLQTLYLIPFPIPTFSENLTISSYFKRAYCNLRW